MKRTKIAAIGGLVLLALAGGGYAASAAPGAHVSAVIPFSVNPTGVGSRPPSRLETFLSARSADSTRCG